MSPAFGSLLQAYAHVIVRVGLNLQPGQRLLVAEPYKLQGVSRHAADLVAAIEVAAQARLGEVAVVRGATSMARTGRLFHHPLLDENACSHIALGEAYGFTLRTPDDAVFNRSLIHVDLPLDPATEVEFA
jgi:leucyl aminopeptidase (aminopeptidase T)